MIARWICGLTVLITLLTADVQAKDQPNILVGTARMDATPTEPVVLAGYGGRTQPYEGIDSKLWARALVIGNEKPVAIVALDNCGVPQSTTDRLAARLANHGIAKDHLIVAATHTHNAPSLVGYAPIVWQGRTTAEQDRLTAEYTTFAITQMEQAVMQALANRQPMTLHWGQGRVTFGGNRRVLAGDRWRGFGLQRDGPVDHSLPVLAARDASGIVRAVWANYACHCTTVGGRNSVGGDWAGFANESMEKKFPRAVSLMTIGCGADIGPQPAGSLEVAQQHGRSIATEVQRLLSGKTTPLAQAPTVVRRQIKLPLEPSPSRDHWEAQLRDSGGFHQQLAKSMLDRLDQEDTIASEIDYAVSVWNFGTDLAIVFLGGEVVVDYAVRLSRELDWQRLWITAWTNDMPGYIPSRRVLIEGGYESEFSQVYYNQPGRYDIRIEDILVETVKELVGPHFAPKKGAPVAPMHHVRDGFRWIPSKEKQTFASLAAWAAGDQDETEAAFLDKLRYCLPRAQPAIDGGQIDGGESTYWNNFAGDHVERQFIRQNSHETALRWTSPAIKHVPETPQVFCFSGGLGWETQPPTAGFALLIEGTQRLTFDVTRKRSHWTSDDGTVELIYLPTWNSDVDSGGFFFVVWSNPDLTNQDRVSFQVRSLGEGSLRWFAVELKQDIATRLKKLQTAIGISADSSKAKASKEK